MSDLLVSEVFGPTLQGEGPDAGRPCHFLRLGGCSIQCGWCDTAYTWDSNRFELSKELTTMTVDAVRDKIELLIDQTEIHRLVISGGEPMQQQSGIAELLSGWIAVEHVEIETSGVIPLTMQLNVSRTCQPVFNVSPKLAHARTKRPYSYEVLQQYAEVGGRFKFVVQKTSDLLEVEQIQSNIGLANDDVWIMPEGTTPDMIVSKTSELWDEVVSRGWNLTTRLHVLAFGNTRGV